MPSTAKNGRRHATGSPTLTSRHKQTARDAIQVAHLINMLHRNAEGTLTKPNLPNIPDPGAVYELSASQVKSIQILLDKALPSLQAVDLKTSNETPQLSPGELRNELGKLLRAMPSEEVSRMLAGDPDLKVIEGEVVNE